jgi:ArsR family transcriptional regulator, arsenate/arsenite/antimonite-responsive transcriptional repressor
MDQKSELSNVSVALAALGHEARLSVYRLLVKAGDAGLNVGQIADHLDLPASTLAHHLRALVHAGLVVQDKQGREIINRPDFDAMKHVMQFLTAECCSGVAERAAVA